MELGTIQTAITTLGFPIFCVIALAYFVWKLWQTSEARSKEREDKLYEVIRESQLQNQKLSATNAEFVTVLESYKTDIIDIKNDVEEIKERIK